MPKMGFKNEEEARRIVNRLKDLRHPSKIEASSDGFIVQMSDEAWNALQWHCEEVVPAVYGRSMFLPDGKFPRLVPIYKSFDYQKHSERMFDLSDQVLYRPKSAVHPSILKLKVSKLKYINNSAAPHWRVEARSDDGSMVDGKQDVFEKFCMCHGELDGVLHA